MKVSVIRIAEREPQDKTERAAFRKAAYLFMLSEIISADSDIKTEEEQGKENGKEEVIHPFRKDKMGKPYLPGHPEVQFNLSHSRNGYVAVASAGSGEAEAVGVDIEHRFSYNEALARKICSEGEYSMLSRAGAREKQDLLNLFWSRKEAILKCEGTGIRSSLKEVDTLHIDLSRYELQERQTDEYTLAAVRKWKHGFVQSAQ